MQLAVVRAGLDPWSVLSDPGRVGMWARGCGRSSPAPSVAGFLWEEPPPWIHPVGKVPLLVVPWLDPLGEEALSSLS